MLNKYIDEVISNGAESVLPQNLDSQWLDVIYVASKKFLQLAVKAEFSDPGDDVLSDVNSMIMLASINEIIQSRAGYSPDDPVHELTEELMFEYISCYALAIILESIGRESDVTIPPASIETIFTRERFFEIEQNNPQITDLLNKLMADTDE